MSKASSGVMELVPIYSVANAEEFLSSIKQMNWNIIGTQSKPVSDDTIPCIPVNELQSEKPSLVIFGRTILILEIFTLNLFLLTGNEGRYCHNELNFIYIFKVSKNIKILIA